MRGSAAGARRRFRVAVATTVATAMLLGFAALPSPAQAATPADLVIALEVVNANPAQVQEVISQSQSYTHLSDYFKHTYETYASQLPATNVQWVQFDGTLTFASNELQLVIPGSEVQTDVSSPNLLRKVSPTSLDEP
jgi:hypothetical protein